MTNEPKKPNDGQDEKGLFLPENKFWRNREKHGTDLKLGTPDELLESCYKYFDWVDNNPLKIMKVFGTGFSAKVPHPRAMTIQGMCGYLGITQKTWSNYRNRAEYESNCEIVEDIMFDQKFAGAAAGLFNAAIIARDLKLTDRIDHTTDDEGFRPTVINLVAPDDVE